MAGDSDYSVHRSDGPHEIAPMVSLPDRRKRRKPPDRKKKHRRKPPPAEIEQSDAADEQDPRGEDEADDGHVDYYA